MMGKCRMCGYRWEIIEKQLELDGKFIMNINCPHCNSQAIVKHENWPWWLIIVIPVVSIIFFTTLWVWLRLW